VIDWPWMSQLDNSYLMGPQILVPEERYRRMLAAITFMRQALEEISKTNHANLAGQALQSLRLGDFG
jgi:hypothetical protein